MRRNITSNQTNVLNYVFSGFPNLFASPNINAPTPRCFYPTNSQKYLRNRLQDPNPCYRPKSILDSVLDASIFFPQQGEITRASC